MGFLFSKPEPSLNNKNKKDLSIRNEIVTSVASSSIVEVLFPGGSKKKRKNKKKQLFQK